MAARRRSLAAEAELADRVRALEVRNARIDQDLTRESMVRRKLHNQIEDMKGKIRVLCRVRPPALSDGRRPRAAVAAARRCTRRRC